MYRRGDVLRLLQGVAFKDPTELEAFGHELRHRLPFRSIPAPNRSPSLVGIPHNVVSPSSGMRSMNPDGDRARRQLNTRFLAGDRLELPPDGDYGAHENLELEWLEAAGSVRGGT